MIACFLSNISAKYYKNPSMHSQVIAKNVGGCFFETQCICICNYLTSESRRCVHVYRIHGEHI